VPGLRIRGLSETDLAAIFVDNPCRLLTVKSEVTA
jgi:predicted metal-dependent phosphotriesterase family hydrolase